MNFFTAMLVAALAYLIGSFSFGIFISALQGRDVRKEGSKSAGATNVSRVMGIGFGLLTFLGDFIKATVAVFVGKWIAGPSGALLAGLFAVIGHNWPVYYRYRGGKGIVCSLAVLLWLFPVIGLIASGIAVLTIALTKYVSLGSLVLLASGCLMIVFQYSFWPEGLWALLLLALAIYQHRSNISRLLAGKENKFSFKSSQTPKSK